MDIKAEPATELEPESVEQVNVPASMKSENDLAGPADNKPENGCQNLDSEREPKVPSDGEIADKLQELLSADGVDFQEITVRQLRQQLEEYFKISLKEKKAFVKAEVFALLEKLPMTEAEEGVDEQDEEDEPVAKRRGGGLAAACQLSEPLQIFLGEETMARTQVVKAVWEYIREHNLQKPEDKRKIKLDDRLSTVFTAPLDMFNMNKQLSKHIYYPEAHARQSSVPKSSAPKKRKSDAATNSPAKPAKRAKKTPDDGAPKKPSIFSRPVQVSEEMADFLGGKKEISRPELTKFFWAYFKENGLQNPSNKQEILADDKLEKLLGEKKFLGFSIQKLIKPHIVAANGTARTDVKKEAVKDEVKAEEDVEVSDMEE